MRKNKADNAAYQRKWYKRNKAKWREYDRLKKREYRAKKSPAQAGQKD